jgi:hypothetical protein
MPETQRDALRFMAQQLLDHLDGPQGGPLLPYAAAMTARDATWQAQRELIKEEVRCVANLIREHISAMALSECHGYVRKLLNSAVMTMQAESNISHGLIHIVVLGR